MIDKGKPSTHLIGSIRRMALDALDVLQMPDRRAQRIATVLLVIRQCTAIEKKMVFGKELLVAKIVDREGFNWAIDQVHTLGPDK